MSNPQAGVVTAGLFPDPTTKEPETYTTGVLPSQMIREMIRAERIIAPVDITDEQVQPASLDLRLGLVAHRVRAGFLPQLCPVEKKIQELKIVDHDLTKPTVFEKDCVYIVPLMEHFNLPADISARANPKSTTGRLDIFTRVITDYGEKFDCVACGHKGGLYAEIVPQTFTIVVQAGLSLHQLRFLRGNPPPSDSLLQNLDAEMGLVYLGEENPAKAQIDRGLRISVKLKGDAASEVVAYKARKNTPAIDLQKINHYSADDFWEAKYEPSRKAIILDPGDFYILASREKIRVPPEFAAEMVAIDPSVGEFRVHYAGFFDPGFGYGVNDVKGTRAVLEVRAHDVPFEIEDGQIIGRLTYMRLLSRPDKVYGVQMNSSYQRQTLTLSKHFKRDS